MIRNNITNLKYSYNRHYEYFNRLSNTYIYSNKPIALILLVVNFSNLNVTLY
jgi:hypothetical protein